MSKAADEFREWMVYLAGRDHVLLVTVRLYPCLADELCRTGAPPAVPKGYPKLCEAALVNGSVGLFQGVTDQKDWRRLFEPVWRGAAKDARVTNIDEWGDRFASAFVKSRAFVAKIARVWPALGADGAERERALSDASAALFRRMWDRHREDLLRPIFQTNFCSPASDGKIDPVATTSRSAGYLRLTFKTFLRNGGSQTLIETPRGEEPMISGTQVKIITQLLGLSERVTLRCQIARVLGMGMKDADEAAVMLLRPRPEGDDADSLNALCEALTVKLTARTIPGLALGSLSRPETSEDARYFIKIVARVLGQPTDPREKRFERAHAHEVLALCFGDEDLPHTVETVEDRLKRFGGAAGVILSLDEPLAGNRGDMTLGDTLIAQEWPAQDRTDLGENLHRIFHDPAIVNAIQNRFDKIFPTRLKRLRGALLLGLPDLLPDCVLETTRLLVERGPPKGDAAWLLLSRLLKGDLASLKREAKELRRQLGEGWIAPD